MVVVAASVLSAVVSSVVAAASVGSSVVSPATGAPAVVLSSAGAAVGVLLSLGEALGVGRGTTAVEAVGDVASDTSGPTVLVGGCPRSNDAGVASGDAVCVALGLAATPPTPGVGVTTPEANTVL